MIKVLQTDLETSAILVNAYALLQHKDGQVLPGLVSHFFSDKPKDFLNKLKGVEDPDLQARMAGFSSNLVHELRHYADLVFTPYGFYRLRVAFEFYNSILPLLSDENNHKIPIPLMSGSDPINQQRLGLGAYTSTPVKYFSDLALSRNGIIRADNRIEGLPGNIGFSIGGDAIMEALACRVQSEWLVNLFGTPACQKRYPHFFQDYEGSKFDVTYRWYGPLMHFINLKPELSTARLTHCILFASLFGSFGEGAKYSSDLKKQSSSDGRDIGDRLPSNRLDKLCNFFKHNPVRVSEDWEIIFEEVDKACNEIWGRGLVHEVEIDINADEEMIRKFDENNPHLSNLCDDKYPVHAFRDIIETRRHLLEIFREDPVCFINPARFTAHLAQVLAPPIIWIYPQGLRSYEMPKIGDVIEICNRDISYIENQGGEKNIKKENICYSYFVHSRKANRINQMHNINAWGAVFSLMGPVYKGFLFGHRYKSMLECDTVFALATIFNNYGEKLVWDSSYYKATDVSGPDEYFDFFDLTEAKCDSCGCIINKATSFVLSGLTVRQNSSFVEHFTKKHGQVAAYQRLEVDWSAWLICREEVQTWFPHLLPQLAR